MPNRRQYNVLKGIFFVVFLSFFSFCCRWQSSQAASAITPSLEKTVSCICKLHVKVRISRGENGLETGLDRQRSVEFGRSHQSVISELLVWLIWENCASTGLCSLRNKSGTNCKARAVGSGSNREWLFTGKMPQVSTVAVQTTVGCLCSFPPTGNQTDRVAYSRTRADARCSQRGYFPDSV